MLYTPAAALNQAIDYLHHIPALASAQGLLIPRALAIAAAFPTLTPLPAGRQLMLRNPLLTTGVARSHLLLRNWRG